MKRYDLRHLKDECLARMGEIITTLEFEEAAIFVYEMGDFSIVEKSANLANEFGCEIVNSLRFNQVDWTMCVRRVRL